MEGVDVSYNVIAQGTDAMQSTVSMHVQEAVTHSVSSPSPRQHPSAAGFQARTAAPADKPTEYK